MSQTVNRNQLDFCLNYLFEEVQSLLMDKSSDYNPSGDVFANVKSIADFMEGTAPSVYFLFLLTKLSRIKGLLEAPEGHEVNFESLSDSLFDLVGYASLLAVYLNKEVWLEDYSEETEEIEEVILHPVPGVLAKDDLGEDVLDV